MGHLLNLDNLLRLYVHGNAGFSGCVPPRLREVQTNNLARLNLPDCAAGASATEPSYTLTVRAPAKAAASIYPGATTHAEGVPVTLTASWNDATHTFAGWSGDCSGSDTTCTVEPVRRCDSLGGVHSAGRGPLRVSHRRRLSARGLSGGAR